MPNSEIRLEGHSKWDYDLDHLKPLLKKEGRQIKAHARRLVSRRAISRAGQFAGKRTGHLQDTINVRTLSGGLAVVVTHKRMKDEKNRYPFILAYGSPKTNVKPRKDHMEEALNIRRSAIRQMLRGALRNAFKPK